MKYLMLIVKTKKQGITEKIVSLKKNLVITIMINIILLKNLISLQQKDFDARLAQADLIAKTDFDTELKTFNQKVKSNKKNHLLVKCFYKYLIQFILEAKVISKNMVHKII